MSVLSNQIAYRVPFIKRRLEYRFGIEKFTKIYFSSEIGLQKPFVGFSKEDKASTMDISQKNIFLVVVRDMAELGLSPAECLFIDDSPKNIKSAKEVGLEGIVFKNVPQMKEDLFHHYNIRI